MAPAAPGEKKTSTVRDMLGTPADKGMTAAQDKLLTLQTQISVEVDLFVKNVAMEEELRDAALAAGNTVIAKVHWERARAVKPKLAAAQQALSVITAQQQALYQQHLNVETMQVLKMSSAMMARGGAGKVESTISLVDAVADNHETENEVASALAGATLTNIGMATAEEDAEWLDFLAKSEGSATPTPMVVPPYMPPEVKVQQETVAGSEECPQKQVKSPQVGVARTAGVAPNTATASTGALIV